MNEKKEQNFFYLQTKNNVSFLAVEQNKDFYNGLLFSSLFWHIFGSGRVSIDPEASAGLQAACNGSPVISSFDFLSDSGMSSYPFSDSFSSSSSDSLELLSSKK
jgi:hypothetical protein